MNQKRVMQWGVTAIAVLVGIGLSWWVLTKWYPAPIDKFTDLTHPSTYQFKTGWLKHEAQVVYPAEARRKNLEGSVILAMKVEADGKISEVKVDESSGYPVLDKSALAAAKRFDIDPEKLGADAFPFEKLLKLTFHLEAALP